MTSRKANSPTFSPLTENDESLHLHFVFPDKGTKFDQQTISARLSGLQQFQRAFAAQRPCMPRLGSAPSGTAERAAVPGDAEINQKFLTAALH
jgi:hypothetical protein